MAKCCLSCSLFTDFRKESYFHLTSKNSRLCCCVLEPRLCCEPHKIEAVQYRLILPYFIQMGFFQHAHTHTVWHVNKCRCFRWRLIFLCSIHLPFFEFFVLRVLGESTNQVYPERDSIVCLACVVLYSCRTKRLNTFPHASSNHHIYLFTFRVPSKLTLRSPVGRENLHCYII